MKEKSRKFFPLSQVKFYANVILKCQQFFYFESEIFSFISSQILRKRYSQMSAISFYLESEIFSFVLSQNSQKSANFLSQVGNSFLGLESEIFSFVRSQI